MSISPIMPRNVPEDPDERPTPPPTDVCPACRDCGFAVIPLASCLSRGRLYLGARGRVETYALLCDRPGCQPGAKAIAGERSRAGTKRDDFGRVWGMRPILSAVEAVHGCDLPALLADHEHQTAEVARAGQLSEFHDVVDSILSKILEPQSP